MAKTLSAVARRELIDGVGARYRISTRAEKRLILKEFSAITGYHHKSAIRVLNQVAGADAAVPRAARPRIYDEAFRRTLVVLWEASDRVCGKRLRAVLPTLVPALEHHGLGPSSRNSEVSTKAGQLQNSLPYRATVVPQRPQDYRGIEATTTVTQGAGASM